MGSWDLLDDNHLSQTHQRKLEAAQACHLRKEKRKEGQAVSCNGFILVLKMLLSSSKISDVRITGDQMPSFVSILGSIPQKHATSGRCISRKTNSVDQVDHFPLCASHKIYVTYIVLKLNNFKRSTRVPIQNYTSKSKRCLLLKPSAVLKAREMAIPHKLQ